MKFPFRHLAYLLLISVAARAQDSLAGIERLTATEGGKFAYDQGVLTVPGRFISTEINLANNLNVDATVLAAISGRPVMKRTVWSAQTSAVAAKFTASKETFAISGTSYVIISAGPGTSVGYTSAVRLVNLATRAVIPAGGSLNPGFVISGKDKKIVLIRAVGPGLAALGVANTVADPILTAFSGAMIVGTNDNWSANAAQTPALQSAFTAVGAFSIAVGSKDSALLLTLSPGPYTLLARGADGGGGEIIVEVYELP